MWDSCCAGRDAIPSPGDVTPMDRIAARLFNDGCGKKNDDGKLRYDLLPTYPLEELVRAYTMGAGKYADHNWRKGFKWGRVFAALCRHAFAWWRGETFDVADGQHHLASVAWCAFALMEYEKFGTGEDDRIKQCSGGLG